MPAVLAALAAVLLAAGCASGSAGAAVAQRASALPAAASTSAGAAGTAGSSGSGPAPASQACAAGQTGPVSASFVSAKQGFLLGITLKNCQADAGSAIVLRKTTDGGMHWTTLPAPPAHWGGTGPDGTRRFLTNEVTSVLFANARDGWAYGPSLWATHDGGASWHRIGTHGQPVRSMAATNGHVVAVTLSCDPEYTDCTGPASFAVRTSPVGSDAWRPVRGATGRGTPSVVARAGTAFVVPAGGATPGTHVAMLTGPADGSARWVSRTLACQPGAIALSGTTASRLVLSCAQLGMHPATTRLYTSADTGRHWNRFATLSLFDGASTVERTAGGTLLVAGIYNGVGLSRDGGRTWTWPRAIDRTDAVGGGDAIEADLFTGSDGYVIVGWGSLWISRDGGRTWRPVTVH